MMELATTMAVNGPPRLIHIFWVAICSIGCAQAIDIGASAVLVNCISAAHTLPFVEGLVDLGVPFGAYANAGRADEGIRGRRVTEADSKHRFPVLESRTTEAGGTGVNHEFGPACTKGATVPCKHGVVGSIPTRSSERK